MLSVRATGTLVSPKVADNLRIENPADFSGSFVVLSGPRVSLGGNLNSSNNALEITLLIRIKPESVGSWLGHLTFFNH